jgi:hypothetical protein
LKRLPNEQVVKVSSVTHGHNTGQLMIDEADVLKEIRSRDVSPDRFRLNALQECFGAQPLGMQSEVMSNALDKRANGFSIFGSGTTDFHDG